MNYLKYENSGSINCVNIDFDYTGTVAECT